MKFSIRQLLALAALVALGMLMIRTRQDRIRDQAEIATIELEIDSLKASLWIDVNRSKPGLHEATMKAQDGWQALAVARQRAESNFEVIQAKYSAIESRGDDVFSIRRMPSIPIEDQPAPLVFRMIVPEKREVWLKFGVHPIEPNHHRTRAPNDESDLLTESPFDQSGPFQMKLPVGEHVLTIAPGTVDNDALPVIIKLDDQVLLKTYYQSNLVNSTSPSHISVPNQFDVPANRRLPWLSTHHMSLSVPTSGGTNIENHHGLTLSLTDEPSEFAEFPGE